MYVILKLRTKALAQFTVKHNKMKKLILILSILILTISCSKDDVQNNNNSTQPTNVNELFNSMGIVWNQTYNWKEQVIANSILPYSDTGKNGTIKFVQPNIMIETYNGNTFNTTFNQNSTSLLSPEWHNKPGSYIINDVCNNELFKENNQIFFRWGRMESGTVYNYKVIIY